MFIFLPSHCRLLFYVVGKFWDVKLKFLNSYCSFLFVTFFLNRQSHQKYMSAKASRAYNMYFDIHTVNE